MRRAGRHHHRRAAVVAAAVDQGAGHSFGVAAASEALEGAGAATADQCVAPGAQLPPQPRRTAVSAEVGKLGERRGQVIDAAERLVEAQRTRQADHTAAQGNRRSLPSNLFGGAHEARHRSRHGALSEKRAPPGRHGPAGPRRRWRSTPRRGPARRPRAARLSPAGAALASMRASAGQSPGAKVGAWPRSTSGIAPGGAAAMAEAVRDRLGQHHPELLLPEPRRKARRARGTTRCA